VADDQRLDSEAIVDAAIRLLDHYPAARVAAVGYGGIFCEMPPGVPLEGHEVVTTRLYDLVRPEYRVAVFDGWRRVRQHGAGTVPVKLGDGEPATMYFLDTRAAWGVLLAIVVPGEPDPEDLGELGPDLPARSRFGRFWRDDLGRVVKMDRAGEEMLGFVEDDLRLQDATDWIHPEHRELAFENWIETLASPRIARRWRCRHLCKDRSYLWVEITNTNLLDDPDHGMVLSEMMDISDEMAVNERLREREELLQRLAESLPSGIVQIDAGGDVVYTNSRLHKILGVGHEPTLRAQFATTVLDDRPRLAGAVDRVISTGVDVDLDLRLDRHERGQQRICQLTLRALRDGHGEVSGAVITVEDVTESTVLRRELERRANVDPLTDCFNRAATMAELERLVRHPGQPGTGTGVVFIDLDKFKPINDRLGHAAGDEVLAAAADRLRGAVREQDVVGRLGGDEFLVVCPGVTGPEVSLALAGRIASHLAEPLVLAAGEPVDLAGSIGVAWSRNEHTTADRLVARADGAMYEAKSRRDGIPVLADPPVDDRRVSPQASDLAS
jgi:diguanylate cyclase (GGDEF)-like protein/PAS domain S-box-containing protein